MKTFETLFHQKYCDVCREYSQNLVQSEEQEWVCPVCEEKYTCHECGAITDEADLTDGHICFDCLDLTKEDLEPVVRLMEESITKLNKLL